MGEYAISHTRRSGIMLIALMFVAGLVPLAGTADWAAAAGTKQCGGPPIKLMSAAGVDVQGGFPALAQPEVHSGARAAAAAENNVCHLGRPIEIVTCDDHSTIPGAIDCANKASPTASPRSSVTPARGPPRCSRYSHRPGSPSSAVPARAPACTRSPRATRRT